MPTALSPLILCLALLVAPLVMPNPAQSQEVPPPEPPPPATFDERVNATFGPLAEGFGSVVFFEVPGTGIPFVLFWLAGAAIFLTLYFKFVNFRAFRLAMRTVKGKYSNEGDPGQITHFQALSAALSATVGLGNIAGVAVAISLGGPGAAFWMVVVGLFGMTTKFAECTLGVQYRRIDAQGRVHGGPMYYLSDGLAERGLKPLGIFLAFFFAVMCVLASLGGGNMFQVNQACSQFVGVTGGEDSFFNENRWIYGVVMALLVGAVIIGGIVSIARVTAKLVPAMCVVYVLGAVVVLLANFESIPAALGRIISGAFNPESAAIGGFIGVLIQGMRRATFSNEAGIGSAPIAHAAVKTRFAASEGVVALLEPFVDTVCVCTMTAVVIVVTGTYEIGLADTSTTKGIQLTSDAFATVISWFPYVLVVAVTLFAFSTLISWSYYGQQAWGYLFGNSRAAGLVYKFIFCAFVVIGSSMSLGSVIDFSDAGLFAMCFPNLLGVYILLPVIKREFLRFQDHVRTVD
ncbi:alanine/glycine:cation symporter family protein [soil metagenome]